MTAGRALSRSAPALGVALLLPMAGFVLLLARPGLDAAWEHHPAHFWLVLTVGAINAVLAYATGVMAFRRGDARVFLVSLAFLASAGFLGLHALATPGVLLQTTNPGFALATPVGLFLGSVFVAASSADLSGTRGSTTMRGARTMQHALVAVMVLWAGPSLLRVPPLDRPSAPERASGVMVLFAVAGIALFAFGAVRYVGLWRRRPSTMLLGMAAAFVLLAEAMVAVAFARNWHASWWEWHVLMLIALGLMAYTAHAQWHEERFSACTWTRRCRGGGSSASSSPT
jgi:adenylate cyclase